jgi:hypothetical protein
MLFIIIIYLQIFIKIRRKRRKEGKKIRRKRRKEEKKERKIRMKEI